MLAYKNFKNQYGTLYRNVVETIKLYPTLEKRILTFLTPIVLAESLCVLRIDENYVHLQDGTFVEIEYREIDSLSLRELLKVLEQLESTNYD